MIQDERHFTAELESLKGCVVTLADVVDGQLELVLKGLVEGNPTLLSDVIAHGSRTAELRVEVDARCLQLVALRQPVAVDLRGVVSALTIAGDLERVGQLTVCLAEAAQRYLLYPPVKPLIDIPRMGAVARTMLRQAVEALNNRDVVPARLVLREDEWLDTLRDQIFRELVTFMLGDPAKIEPAIEL